MLKKTPNIKRVGRKGFSFAQLYNEEDQKRLTAFLNKLASKTITKVVINVTSEKFNELSKLLSYLSQSNETLLRLILQYLASEDLNKLLSHIFESDKKRLALVLQYVATENIKTFFSGYFLREIETNLQKKQYSNIKKAIVERLSLLTSNDTVNLLLMLHKDRKVGIIADLLTHLGEAKCSAFIQSFIANDNNDDYKAASRYIEAANLNKVIDLKIKYTEKYKQKIDQDFPTGIISINQTLKPGRLKIHNYIQHFTDEALTNFLNHSSKNAKVSLILKATVHAVKIAIKERRINNPAYSFLTSKIYFEYYLQQIKSKLNEINMRDKHFFFGIFPQDVRSAGVIFNLKKHINDIEAHITFQQKQETLNALKEFCINTIKVATEDKEPIDNIMEDINKIISNYQNQQDVKAMEVQHATTLMLPLNY